MKNKVLSEDIDRHPYTGIRQVTGKVRVKECSYLAGFFNGADNYNQVKNVAPGKIYEAVRAEGFGDVENITIIDDSGAEHPMADFFFEEVECENT